MSDSEVPVAINLGSWLWGIPTSELPVAHGLLTCSGRTWAVGEFVAEAAAYADVLGRGGVGERRRVVCAASSSLPWIFAIAGLWRLGAVPIVMRALVGVGELTGLARECAADFILFCNDAEFQLLDGRFGDKWRPAALMLPALSVPTRPSNTKLTSADNRPLPEVEMEIVGQTTSGSTGTPKVVMHTATGIRGFAEALHSIYDASPSDSILTSADISFGYGFGNTLLVPIVSGTRLVLLKEPTNAERIAEAIHGESITIAALSPRMFEHVSRLLAGKRTALRTAVCAGEVLSTMSRTLIEGRIGVPIVDGYGATELLHIVATRRSAHGPFIPVAGMELSLVATDTADVSVLTVRGPMARAYYLVASKDDRSRYSADSFRTADGARLVAGGVQILGRMDEQINRGGVLFSPVVTETAARQHFPQLQSVLTEVSNPATGEARLVMGIVGNDDDLRDATTMEAKGVPAKMLVGPGRLRQIRHAIRSTVPPYAVPDSLVRLPRIPSTATGKLDRSEAARMCLRRIGTSIRWRELKAIDDGPRIIVFPCGGGSPDMYEELIDSVAMNAAGIDLDLREWSSIDEIIRASTNLLSSEVRIGDLIFSHSLGATLLDFVLQSAPLNFGQVGKILFAPAVSIPTEAQVAVLTEQAVVAFGSGDHKGSQRLVARIQATHEKARTLLANESVKWPMTRPAVDDELRVVMRPTLDVLLAPNDARQIEIDGAGHFSPITDGRRIATQINEFRSQMMSDGALEERMHR